MIKKLRRGIAGGAVALAVAGLCAIAPATAANAYSGTSGKGCTAYVYSRGGYSTCVGQIQRMLNGVQSAYGLGSALAVDNSFGPATESQVRKFQSWVYITSDGIVGRNTWNTLCSYAGQVNFAYASSSAAKRTAWQAAYDAGCYVEKPASGSPGYITISKY
ncbi:peptidoglycan-binding domain-containing protein [Agromyces sp. H3Y2-19a]|uniref:peptidoglycan-binding domain-containing protein n=1 Tax=Agromyces TaxID=33877 RepID=UPI0023B93572|nr:peptidoglycan-binding domain-containing protein [Agromyces chromiiresistens]MDF0514177.1 peptidoglycan-binding domain-containing protein [Agromyces chromiiresistens]